MNVTDLTEEQTALANHCLTALRTTEDTLDRFYKHLTVKLRELGFALHPRWEQHDLLYTHGAARYITRTISDKHGQSRDRASIWVDFSVSLGEDVGEAVCGLRIEFEQFAPGDDPAKQSSLPRVTLERKRDIVWSDSSAGVWQFAADIGAKRDALVEEFCGMVLDTISP